MIKTSNLFSITKFLMNGFSCYLAAQASPLHVHLGLENIPHKHVDFRIFMPLGRSNSASNLSDDLFEPFLG